MCDLCNNPSHSVSAPLSLGGVNIDDLIDEFTDRVTSLVDLKANLDNLSARDQNFADSLISQFESSHALSASQWHWAGVLHDRAASAEPLKGDFNAILGMFALAGERLQKPKIRLVTKFWDADENLDRQYVQLHFNKKHRDTGKPCVEVYIGGYAGYGRRLFAGWIYNDKIIAYRSDRLTKDVVECIQKFSLDPARCAIAIAQLIGACIYCNHQLTDDVSKAVGYGKQCADNYGLPYGPEAAEAAKANVGMLGF